MCKGTSVEIKPIRGEADYHGALETIDALMGAPPNTPEADAFEIIAVLVEATRRSTGMLEHRTQ